MICQQCKNQEANIHISGLINGKAAKVNLCENCLSKSGLSLGHIQQELSGWLGSPVHFPSVSPSLSQLFGLLSEGAKIGSVQPSQKTCPRCRWTLDQLRKTGKMGCPECYGHFRAQTEALGRKIHGTSLHRGKKPGKTTGRPRHVESPDTLASLKEKLEKAVKEEKYELAAELRDKIKLASKA